MLINGQVFQHVTGWGEVVYTALCERENRVIGTSPFLSVAEIQVVMHQCAEDSDTYWLGFEDNGCVITLRNGNNPTL